MTLSNLHLACLFAATASKQILNRIWLLDAMTVTSGHLASEFHVEDDITIGKILPLPAGSLIPGSTRPVRGQVVCVNDQYTGICMSKLGMEDEGTIPVAILSTRNKPIFHRFDEVEFKPDIILEELGINQFTKFVGKTTFGRYLENVFIFQIPFNFRIFPHFNKVLKPDDVVGVLSKELIRHGTTMTVAEYKQAIENLFFLNHISEICVPSMNAHSLQTHPEVAAVKAKFIEEHKDKMSDPSVIKELEDTLIALDKEWIGDDESKDFFSGLGSKSWNLHRKKLFLTTGGIPAFDTFSGKFDFIPNSLSEGWTKEAIPSIVNEARKGSYERGVETAKGGAETKLVYRVFQDLQIVSDDCGTKRTIPADFKNTFRVKDFIGRWLQTDKGDVLITEANMHEFDGKVCRLYSPMTCEQKHDLCYKCCGQRAKELGVKLIGIAVVRITSKYMNLAMKNMHGTELQIRNIDLGQILL